MSLALAALVLALSIAVGVQRRALLNAREVEERERKIADTLGVTNKRLQRSLEDARAEATRYARQSVKLAKLLHEERKIANEALETACQEAERAKEIVDRLNKRVTETTNRIVQAIAPPTKKNGNTN